MAGPLAGIKVIEVGQALAGPLAGMILADMGAEVIKVEKPDGGDDARLWGPPFIDGDALFFHATNRNKKSVTIDIKSAEDVDKLKMLVRSADILIQNLRPGIVGEMGIGPDVMIAENPRLIYCSIWAFGHKGPLQNAPGFDPLLQAYGGVMTMTGRPEDPPTFCGPAINDISTGMWCVIGALGVESAVSWVGGAVNGYLLNGNVPKRHGTGSNLLVPYQVFETADRPICIAAGNDRLWVKCAQALGRPEWATDERFSDGRKRATNREVLIPLIAEVVRTQTREHWIAALGKVGVPVAPVNNVAELAQSEQLAAMDMKRTLPGSGLSVMGLPLNFDGQRPHPHSDSPKLGQHNKEVFG